MHKKFGLAATAASTMVATLMTGCTTAPQSPIDRIRARGEAAGTIIDDPQRAARAKAAFEGLHDAAIELESSIEATRAELLAMHHDPTAAPADFRAALQAMRDRQKPMLLEIVDRRLEAAASTTEVEWKRLQKD